MSDLSPAAYDALAHAVWGGLADAGIAYEHRFELAEVILDEMVGVFAAPLISSVCSTIGVNTNRLRPSCRA